MEQVMQKAAKTRNKVKSSEISKEDLDFLHSKTGLAPNKLVKLVEEPRDLALMLDSVSSKISAKTDLAGLSPKTVVRLIVFRASKGRSFDISEKDFVSDILYRQYLKVKKGKKFLLTKPTHSMKIEEAEEYFIGLGCFQEKFAKNAVIPAYRFRSETTFRIAEKRDFAAHYEEWIGILQGMEKEGWLDSEK